MYSYTIFVSWLCPALAFTLSMLLPRLLSLPPASVPTCTSPCFSFSFFQPPTSSLLPPQLCLFRPISFLFIPAPFITIRYFFLLILSLPSPSPSLPFPFVFNSSYLIVIKLCCLLLFFSFQGNKRETSPALGQCFGSFLLLPD